MYKLLFLTLTAFALPACTSINVKKVDARKHDIKLVCIEENPKVQVSDLLMVLENGFNQRGIDTMVYHGKVPERCNYTLWYTARRSWDVATFLREADLRLRHGDQTIATASYRHSGGLALNKWASTASKLDPMIAQLLADFDRVAQ